MPTPTQVELHLELRGGLAELWTARDREILVEGPRGTGKTRVILELINQYCQANLGLRVLIVRKYQKTLTGSCLRTFHEQVLHPGDGVRAFGGNDQEASGYIYGNGSRIYTGGMDEPDKVKSSEYDLIYANEVTELTEEDFESLLPLLRHLKDGQPVIKNQRIIGDCNPANQSHWANARCEKGQMRRIRTKLSDNPVMYTDDGIPTEYGERYLATLTSLTGSRRERWLDGLWTGMENAIYPAFDRAVHIRTLPPNLYFKATVIGEDYGATHKCGVVAVSIDQFNRRWVRECWGQPDTDQGYSLNLTVSQFKERYGTKRGRGDPNQRYLNDRHGFSTAKGQAGARLHRVDLLDRLWYTYPGGRVPTFTEEKTLTVPQGPFAEPDSPGLILVEGGEGIDDLALQLEGYHYIYTETPKGAHKDVYRDDEDLIAALEYANEEIEEGIMSYFSGRNAPMTSPLNEPHVDTGTYYSDHRASRGSEYTRI